MGRTVSGQYDNPVELRVSFDAPDTVTLVLQGPALEAYLAWKYSGTDEGHDEFMDALQEQCEDHIAQWTFIRDWDYA